ncbi:MAG: hypothetical protein IT180_18490 [Acidobacteria bacterium]|nr:hypothetical protein [Acidobacteriota bacterium]
MAPRSVVHSLAVAGIIVAVALAAWWLLAPRAAMPPVSPLGDQWVYTTADDPRLPLIEPVVHAAWESGSPAGAHLLAVVVLAAGAGMAIVAGASATAVLFVLLALALDASFGAALVHGSGLAVAVGLVWLAAGGAFSESSHPGPRPWLRSLAAILLWALAVWWHWLALAAWPIVFAGLRRRPERSAWMAWTLVSLVAGSAAFVAHLAWMAGVAQQQAFAPDVALRWRDVLVVAFDSRPRLPIGSFAAPEVTHRLPNLATALVAVGLAFGTSARWWRRSVMLTAGCIAAAGVGWPEWQAEALRFGLWLMTPLAAVGLTWASRQTGPHRQWLAAGALGAVLVAEAVATSARPLTGQDARGFRDALEDELGDAAAAAGGLVIMAEDTRLDSALSAWMAGRPDVWRAAQDGAVVAEALSAGRTVLAGPTARQHLLLAGVQFSDAFVIADPAPLGMSVADAVLRCAIVRADRWSLLPGVEYSGRLGVDVPARPGGEMQVIVGDTLPLAVRVETPDGRPVPVNAEALLRGPGSSAPPADYWLESGTPEQGPPLASRLHLAAHPVRSTLLSLRLGRRAPRVLARLVGFDKDARGRICAAPVGQRVLFRGGLPVTQVPLDEQDLFGRGWYGVGNTPAGVRTRGTDTDPVLLLRSAERTSIVVELDAEPAVNAEGFDGVEREDSAGAADGAAGSGRRGVRAADQAGGAEGSGQGDRTGPGAGRPALVTLHVNGIDVGTRPMAPGMGRYRWRVAAGVWLAGTNELWWHVSRAGRPADRGGDNTRTLALRVSSVTIRRAAEPGSPGS